MEKKIIVIGAIYIHNSWNNSAVNPPYLGIKCCATNPGTNANNTAL